MTFAKVPYPDIATVDAGSFNYESYNFQDILCRLDANVLVVTLNRPSRHNAFTSEMCAALLFAFELADADPRVRVVVLTGAGKSFCAGADLGTGSTDGFGAPSGSPVLHHRDGGGMTSGAIFRCRKLVIAAINGNAVGIGLTMVLPADIRIVADSAKIALPFVKRGITLEAMSAYFLPRLVGHVNALEIAMTGDTMPPTAKCLAPLWSKVLPANEVLSDAMQLAKRLAVQNSVLSMALNKALLWRTPSTPEKTHLLDSACVAASAQASDASEGVISFLEKRQPDFKGSLEELEGFGFYPWWTQTDVYGRGNSRVIRAPAKL